MNSYWLNVAIAIMLCLAVVEAVQIIIRSVF